MADKGVSAVITGSVGPNAMNVLKAAEIDVHRGLPTTVKENIAKFKEGPLRR